MSWRDFLLVSVLLVITVGCADAASLAGQMRRFLQCWNGRRPGDYGSVFVPGDLGYNERMGRNFQPDPSAFPAAFVDCRNEFFVQAAIKCAAESGFRVCPRSGGHSRLGSSMCNGIVLEMGPMDTITMGADNVEASFGPGVTNARAIYELHKNHSHVIPVGKCPTVALGGFILGGGLSEFSDRLGFACDNLLEISGVNGKGEFVTANKDQNSELFWSSCGAGGGQFAAFYDYRLKTTESSVLNRHVGFRYRIDADSAPAALNWYFGFEAQDRKYITIRMKIVILGRESKTKQEWLEAQGACYDTANRTQCFDRLRRENFFDLPWQEITLENGTDVLQLIKFFNDKEALTDEQALLDPGHLYLEGRRVPSNVRVTAIGFKYTDSANNRPPPSYFENYLAQSRAMCNIPGVKRCTSIFQALGEGITSVPLNKTAFYGMRLSTHWVSLRTEGTNAANSEASLRRHRLLLKSETHGNFVNYLDGTLDGSYKEAYWGPEFSRLEQVKLAQDPWDLFLAPQPVKLPSTTSRLALVQEKF